jgi:hypothetical protein
MRVQLENLRAGRTGIKCFQSTLDVSCLHAEARRGSLARGVSLLTAPYLRGEVLRKKQLYEMEAV